MSFRGLVVLASFVFVVVIVAYATFHRGWTRAAEIATTLDRKSKRLFSATRRL